MSAPRKRTVLFDDPDYQLEDGAYMEFRLTYAGPLYATQRGAQGAQRDRRSDHKHAIRRVFHEQLKKLWAIYPALDETLPRPVAIGGAEGGPPPALTIQELAAKHLNYGFNFVPLVTDELRLLCGLDILILRDQKPGGIIETGNYGGDVDNRLKTLINSLAIPTANEYYSERLVLGDEKPLFCLLEDDKLITKVSFETDYLLEEIKDKTSIHDVRVLINVGFAPTM